MKFGLVSFCRVTLGSQYHFQVHTLQKKRRIELDFFFLLSSNVHLPPYFAAGTNNDPVPEKKLTYFKTKQYYLHSVQFQNEFSTDKWIKNNRSRRYHCLIRHENA